jgi:hypothetical protein
VGDFIKFLPILAYDGSSMKEIDAAGILDMAMSGTTATLLARRWESALLVNVDNTTLLKLKNNEEAMAALMSIEGFRSLRQDIETIINKTDKIKKTKSKDKAVSKKEKKELTDAEKETKSLRKSIQEKLIKFATRIPVFMYLTDFREYCLKDVITQLEPGLFKKVTGLSISDFELLVSLNVFNAALMNDAVYKFKCYEDSSLTYTGLKANDVAAIGLFDTVIYSKPIQEEPIEESAITAEEDIEDNQFTIKVGSKVQHKSFGEGIVTALDDKFMTCQFDGGREKKFFYPECFEKGYFI